MLCGCLCGYSMFMYVFMDIHRSMILHISCRGRGEGEGVNDTKFCSNIHCIDDLRSSLRFILKVKISVR